MTKAMTAAQKDQLLADAKAVGLYVTRTSTDFHLTTNDGKRRVTPGEIRRLITEAEEAGRVEAFETAAEIRAELDANADQGEPDTLEDALETALDGAATPAPEGAAATPAAPEQTPAAPAPASEATPTKAKRAPKADATDKPKRAVITYGPPCGGSSLSVLAVATSDDARNPLMHLDAKPSTVYASKELAAAAGRALGKDATWIAFLALAGTETFWALAVLQDGRLTLDGQPVEVTLLEGAAADAARGKVQQARLKTKAQWQVSRAA
ncbi:hypothetical protein [Deinococcus soli (ex Cha et al. 2016)]|uniref:hypothetical protein n=1 Tax=Deinococcus soli (ex Cha et al. 2016) TaxID=1309411 RepID=UPI00166A9782|nr:hypothetical protein [Deinococcus soli (ex Cha et al. 2016)]GGB77887.1 hypothetical protein GCM10008019_37650 [Deinococcus soli (ex Cha et al. 2016)]